LIGKYHQKMNQIEKERAEIRKYFNENNLIENSLETFISNTGNFQLNTCCYRQTKPDVNWSVTKVEVVEIKMNEKIFEFYVNDSHFFHGWAQKDKTEFLICAEDLFGGQSVVDLTNRKMASFSTDEDGFIWTEFHLSPNGTYLATIGCVWACPYTIKVFDFQNPLNLPLKEIEEIILLDDEQTMIWLDNETIQTVCNNPRTLSLIVT
jgi:hypothetical protein